MFRYENSNMYMCIHRLRSCHQEASVEKMEQGKVLITEYTFNHISTIKFKIRNKLMQDHAMKYFSEQIV